MNRHLHAIISFAIATSLWTGCSQDIAEVCEEDEYVVEQACVPCPPGTENSAGDDASGDDTTCEALLCLEMSPSRIICVCPVRPAKRMPLVMTQGRRIRDVTRFCAKTVSLFLKMHVCHAPWGLQMMQVTMRAVQIRNVMQWIYRLTLVLISNDAELIVWKGRLAWTVEFRA